MTDLNKLKELALHWSRSEVACMPVEEFSDVSGTPPEDAEVMFGAANALGELIDRLEAAEKRVAEMEVRGHAGKSVKDIWKDRAWAAEEELARRDSAAGEPVLYALRFKNSQGVPNKEINDNCLFRSYEKARAYGLGGNYVTQPDGKIERVPYPALDPEVIPLYTEQPPAALPSTDYFSGIVSAARQAAEKAMVKFPQPNYVLLKVAEEAGEVVQAGVHYAEGRETWKHLEDEVVQTIAMLYRLVIEGDMVNGIVPPKAAGGSIADAK